MFILGIGVDSNTFDYLSHSYSLYFFYGEECYRTLISGTKINMTKLQAQKFCIKNDWEVTSNTRRQ